MATDPYALLSPAVAAPVNIMSGYAAPDPLAGFAQPVAPDPTTVAQQNYLQQATTPAPTIDPNASAPPIVVNGVQPSAAPQAQPGYAPAAVAPPTGPAPGMPQGQLPDQAAPGGNTPRKRLSAIDVIGRLSDVLAKVGGSPEQYQPYLDARVATAQQQQAAGLDNTAKQEDIAQTAGTVQDANNARVGQALKGVKALVTANPNTDLSVAWPAMAQQLGIDHATAAQVGQALNDDPAHLDGLIAATESTKGGEEKFGNSPVYLKDPTTGQLVLGQVSDRGNFKRVDAGGLEPTEGQTVIHQGDKDTVLGNKSGLVKKILPVVGASKAEDIPIYDAKGNITGYRTAPGGQGAQDAALKGAQIDKLNQENSAGTQAQTAAYSHARGSLTSLYNDVDDIIKDPQLGAATGLQGSIGAHIPGSARANVQAKVDKAVGQSLTAAIDQIRQAGATKGVSIRLTGAEAKAAQDAFGPLKNLNQSHDSYVANARKAQSTVADLITKIDQQHASTTPARPAAIPKTAVPKIVPRTGGTKSPTAPTVSNW